jgi:hypothetical protein
MGVVYQSLAGGQVQTQGYQARLSMNRFSACLLLFLLPLLTQAQTILQGYIYNQEKEIIPFANIVVNNGQSGTTSNELGFYSIRLQGADQYIIKVSYSGLIPSTETISNVTGGVITKNFTLLSPTINGVIITEELRTSTMQKLNGKVATFVPSASGDFINSILASQGVSMRNELSSAYSVRGGSFDENLIYVNDIEIYRPFLVRAGQQEGLSFINGDLVSNVSFSAGGFDARFGDKLSSVLDIQYRKPTKFAGSAMASLLGGAFHVENRSKNEKTSYIAGIRYRSNSYLLGSLDTKGEYKPRFTDFQTYITHKLTDKLDISFLGNYASNRYNFVPQTRETELGTIQQALRFTVFFDGQEISKFQTGLGAVDLNYNVNDDLRIKLILSQFFTSENEEFDIVGQYSLNEIERDFGSDNFGEVVRNLGVGGFLNHARNKLTADVKSVQLKGYYSILNHYIQFGAGIQADKINDRLSEYVYIDSADYSLPQRGNSGLLEVQEVIRARNSLESQRLTAYVQDAVSWFNGSEDEFRLNIGARVNHWTLNQQTVVSPRFTAAYIPNWRKELDDSTYVKKDVVIRFSAGYYYQPPFYRELRNFKGQINPRLQAQKSIHFVLGTDYNILLWRRPFKFVAEAYYKILEDLVPYELENVRLRYYATNTSKGFARGLDFKLNGEFVSGLESWLSLSFLQTREDLVDDYYYNFFNKSGEQIYPYTFDNVATDSVLYHPGSVPRPTDQLVNFGMFFQDEMPGFKGFKVNLSLLYGTGVPYGPPSYERYKDTLRAPAYRRVDIGFMKELIKSGQKGKGLLKNFREAYLSLEVFNLLQINNTINYTWIRDVSGSQYAIPNFLTSRRVNLKLQLRF